MMKVCVENFANLLYTISKCIERGIMNGQVEGELNTVVATIKEEVNAQEIYLFGSFANGNERIDSDFDIYVVLDSTEIRPIKAIQKINYALSHKDLRSVDILANYYNVFMSTAQAPSLEKEILERGVKLYERDNSSYKTMA